MKPVEFLIPTCDRPAALAVTLTALASQEERRFDVIVSDQTEGGGPPVSGEVTAAVRLLESKGSSVFLCRHLPKRGMAEQRQFLLNRASSRYVMFLDDDVVLEPFVLRLMLEVMSRERCGFVGSALIGLSYVGEVRPHEQDIEVWDGPVEPETVLPGSAEWDRHVLHNAANVYHVQRAIGATPESPVRYKVAWVGGCVLYDRAKLIEAGGYSFWRRLPPNHAGEDVLAQLRVMALFGGCGILPSGAYHQELPTLVPDRRADAPWFLGFVPARPAGAGRGRRQRGEKRR